MLWRRFLECNAPNLQLADGAPSTFEALSSYAAAGATEAAVGAPGTGGDVPGGMPGSWCAARHTPQPREHLG
mgnify:CR=1 FL=1